MSNPAIIVKNLSKRYRLGAAVERFPNFREAVVRSLGASWRRLRQLGDGGDNSETLWALRDVGFDVQPGEVIGIVGRNGAGKSTLLKILSRITEPTEGTVDLWGRVASLLEVGTGFHQELTGRENIFLNGAILGMRRAEIACKFDAIVAFAGVERFLDTPVKRYSSGMYVRLAFAVAAHLEPEILIVDEVLAVGDGEFQKKCLGKMREVATADGRTVLFVSHNLYAVQMLCQRAIWLEQGTIQQQGDVEPVVSAYKQHLAELGQGLREAADRDSAELEITAVRVNGRSDRYLDFAGGDDLRVELELRVRQPVVVSIGVSLSNAERVYVCGLATHLEGDTYRLAPGRYRTGVTWPRLRLGSGQYTVQTAVMDAGGTHAYGYRDPVATLNVATPFGFDGLLELDHVWHPPTVSAEGADAVNNAGCTVVGR